MWRLIKAEITYKAWEPLGSYFVGWLVGLGFWNMIILTSKRPIPHEEGGVLAFVLLWGVAMPFVISIGVFQNREFKEFRLRAILPLPVSIKEIAVARMLILFVAHLAAILLSLLALYLMGTGDGLGLAAKLVAVSLLAVFIGLHNRLIPELAYFGKKGMLTAIILSFAFIPFFILYIMLDEQKSFFRGIWKWSQEPVGMVSFLAAVIVLFLLNRALFVRRRDYSKVHKPVMNIVEMFRMWRGVNQLPR